MAVSFTKAKGEAQKSNVTYMKLTDGMNQFRIVGGLLPMYTYWVDGTNGKQVPFESLQFDRNTERFDNSAPEPVKEFFPDARCSWSYKCQVINRATGAIEVLQLKKAIMEGIMTVAEALEIDPACPETGTEFFVKRTKTGPHAYNVSYEVVQLKCKSAPVSAEDLKLIQEMKTIDELVPRATVEAQREALQKLVNNVGGANDNSVDDEAMDELD